MVVERERERGRLFHGRRFVIVLRSHCGKTCPEHPRCRPHVDGNPRRGKKNATEPEIHSLSVLSPRGALGGLRLDRATDGISSRVTNLRDEDARHCLLDISRERRLYDRSFSYRDDYKPTKSREKATTFTTFCEIILEIGIATPLLSHEVNVNPKGVFCACRNKHPLRLSYPLASESNLLCSIKRSYVIIMPSLEIIYMVRVVRLDSIYDF